MEFPNLFAFFEKKFDKPLYRVYNIYFGNPIQSFYRSGGSYRKHSNVVSTFHVNLFC